ncbi:MAG: hypothetical protein GXY74_17105 [Phycisphaerae bacterium]|nr:hypothetical protein [Phycisphaerae bacterium]
MLCWFLMATVLAAPCAAEEFGGSATVRFAVTDLALSGRTVPLEIDLVNSSASDLGGLSLTTNQLLNYRLDALVPAGRRGSVCFAPLYFGGAIEVGPLRRADGSLQFRLGGPDDDAASGLISGSIALEPRPLAAQVVVILFDSRSLDPDRLHRHLARWTDCYTAAAGSGSRGALVRLQPVDPDALRADLLTDAPVAALVIPAASARREDMASLARGGGLDLWAVDAEGRLEHVVRASPLLRSLAGGTHLRPDLFDPAVGEQASYVAPHLFQYRPWSRAARLRLLLPVAALGGAILVLTLLGGRLRRPSKLALLAAMVAAAVAWTLVVLNATPSRFADTVSVVQVDLAAGQSVSEHLAAVYSHRTGLQTLRFQDAASGMPRPLMMDDGGRPFYQGTTLHRHSDGHWSALGVPLRSGSFLAFGATAWEASPVPPDNVQVSMQSGRPVVRWHGGEPLADAWLYVDGHGYRLGDLAGEGTYAALGDGVLTDAAAMSDAAPRDPFRRRAMRWIARRHYRADRCLLFGWQSDAAATVEADGAETTRHGRLVILALPRSEVRSDARAD